MLTRPWLVALALTMTIYTTTMVQAAEKNDSWCLDNLIDDNTMSVMKQIKNTAMGEGYQTVEVGNETAATNNSSGNSCKEAILDDIIISQDQAVEWLNCLQKKEDTRVKRSIINFERFPSLKWTNSIPYRVDAAFSSAQVQAIVKALDNWASRTCVSFRELPSSETASHYVRFRGGRGCISFVGRVPNQPQPVFLAPSCFSARYETITHEVGHVLGLWHTHMRPDRSSYVKVNMRNILEDEEGSFIELPPQLVTDHTGYDYASLMHFDPLDLSRASHLKILETLDPLYQKTIGQRVEVSFRDAKAVNLAYCSENCANFALPPVCQHGGYQDPRDCSVCICPDGWSGDVCQNLASSRGDTCGGELLATTTRQTISSPRYELGSGYPRFQECTWRIRTETSQAIQFKFIEKLGIFCTPDANTCHDWVEIRFRLNDTDLGPRFCCETPPETTFTAETDEVMVIFKALDTVSESVDRRGFKLEYYVDAVRCDPDPCKNGATCLTTGTTQCMCPAGYTGSTCATPIPQPCDRLRCQNGGTCQAFPNGTAVCICPANFTGRICHRAVSRCDSNPCQGGGNCLQFGTLMCVCPSNRTGLFCETEFISPCESSPCQNNGTCLVTRGNYFCVCPSGYRGYQCETAPDPCQTMGCVFGRCELRAGRPFCVCNPGSTGPRCSFDINECTSLPCRNNGTCYNIRNDYVCVCQRYFRGKQCQIETGGCSSNPCGQNGRCTVVGNRYRCICNAGWTGINCQIRLSPCSSRPCRNGGTCASAPGSNTFSCTCPIAFSGRTCNIGVNACSSRPCRNGGTCNSRRGSTTFSCVCPGGFSGRTCNNVANRCSPNPCLGGGTCFPRRNTYFCICPSGRRGPRCQQITNACGSNPCPRGTCMALTDGRYVCMCGGLPCGDTDTCGRQPCLNGGRCTTQPGSTTRTCVCPRGFTGNSCENRPNTCSATPCRNGGTCRVRGSSYQCICPPGLSGRNCERGNCGACGEPVGAQCDPCVQMSTIRTICRRTVFTYTHTHVLIFFRRTVRRSRIVSYACTRRVPLWQTATCCDNAKMFFDSNGRRKCVVEGQGSFSSCSGRCGGCGVSTRKSYSVYTNGRGRGSLIVSSQTQACNTAVCRYCSNADRIACRCAVPCCQGFRQVGRQCVRNRP